MKVYKDGLRSDFFGVPKSVILGEVGCGVITEDEFSVWCRDRLGRVVEEGERLGIKLSFSGRVEFTLLGEVKGDFFSAMNEERECVYSIYNNINISNIQYNILGERERAFDIGYLDALEFCNTVSLLRYLVKREFFAHKPTFMPKPISTKEGAGFKIKMKISGEREVEARFLGGLALHSPEYTVFTNSCANSYPRLNSKDCPHYVCVGEGQDMLVRRIKEEGGVYELAFPDNSCNCYLCVISLILAGEMGVLDRGRTVDEIEELNPVVIKDLVRLPTTLYEAIVVSEGSGFMQAVLGERYKREYFSLKRAESEEFDDKSTEEEYIKKYFPLL
ncbi:MAG: hypothetical protein IJF76_00210 [Clostridia bacterium]|nr:hypothetical protein [Clostridia bacterium]